MTAMTPERWAQVGRLYETACALAGDERATFLLNACSGDEMLREEVESLLASEAAAGEYLGAGALADAARLVAEGDPRSLVGRTFDHYTVLSLLGSGGMGDVYRARDSRLGRDVAIKMIPGLVMGSAEVRSRFETEARAVAALSHSNVRALYDVGEVDSRLYAVMELLEGESLRGRLGRGRLPVGKAIEIGTGIAAGLAAAHRKGIVHRDLKPENVFITTAGQIKVLDFGLAKMADGALDASGRDDHGTPQTASTVVLGTVGYTSPEQAAGKEVDARSDIFSLGCVLYEMATGHRAFERRTGAETMAAIAGEEPAELDAIPLELRRIVARCLEKEADARFQSAQDLAFALRTILEAGADTGTSETRRARASRRGPWILVAAAGAAVIVAIAASTFPRRERPATIRSFLLPPADIDFCSDCGIALSPDGRRLAFAARQRGATTRYLWVQSLGDSSARPLEGTEGARFPFWSPDSQWLGFFTSNDALKRIGASGGSVQRLCSPCAGQGTWGESGIIVFGSARNPLRGVSASGGQPFSVTELDPSQPEIGHVHPVFLPGGRRLLFRKGFETPTGRGIYTVSLDSKATEFVMAVPGIVTPNAKVFVAAGRLLFVQENTLMAVRFDHGRVRVEGPAEPVAQTGGPFAVSGAGVLVYAQPAPSQLAWVDRTGREIETLPIVGTLYEPSLSHDDRRVAITRFVDGNAAAGDVWVYDLAHGHGTRLTSDMAHDRAAVWSPDDEWIVFSSGFGIDDLHRKRSNGSGEEEVLSMSGFHGEARSWSRDSIIAHDLNDGSNLWHLSLPQQRATVLFETPFRELSGEISPDGQYIAYVSNETGNTEVYLQPFPPAGERWQVSKAGGWWPKWSGDGRELFFLEGHNKNMMVAEVRAGAASPVGVPQPLFAATMLHERVVQFDVTADGQRFLVIKPAADPGTGRITLIQNWTAGLTHR
jgi:eukaryotic-like serine/threonine-protein kinase